MFDFSSNAKQKEAWLFLDTLWQGPEYLCQQIERVERERAKPDKNFAYVNFSSSPGDAMRCNYFLWYANALYNFIGVFKKGILAFGGRIAHAELRRTKAAALLGLAPRRSALRKNREFSSSENKSVEAAVSAAHLEICRRHACHHRTKIVASLAPKEK